MSIDNLPGAGSKFSATLGPGSFKNKLSSKVRSSHKHIAPYKDALVEVVRANQTNIKRGGLSLTQRKSAWLKLKRKIGSNVSSRTSRDLKKIIDNLGKDNFSSSGKTGQSVASKGLSLQQRRRNIMESRRSSGHYNDDLKGGRSNFANTGAKAQGVAGASGKGLGLKGPKTGFAGQFKKAAPLKPTPKLGGGLGRPPIGF